mmetsp:Transcript_36229/g.114292  ORF Transcript_36229/g.114292 Transcript_36229/m.114292 type:complete len:510 (-) Transcript_36229:260-1789(-)
MPKNLAIYACAPGTTRGKPTLLGGHAESERIAYCNGRSVIVRSLRDPMDVVIYSEHQHPTTVARFSPNGEWIASGDITGTVRVWPVDTDDHKLKLEIQAISGSISDIAWSPDGERIVAVGDSRGVQAKCFMWDSGNNVGDFSGMSKRINTVDFKPSRPFRIVCGGDEFSTYMFEGPPFKYKGTSKDHTNFVNCIRYSPDGTRFVSVGSDGKGILYDGATGEKAAELPTDGGHAGTVNSVSWSPDGKQLLTAGADKTAKLWDVSAAPRLVSTFTFSSSPQVGDMQVGTAWVGAHIVTLSLSGALNILDPAAPSAPKSRILGHQKAITRVVAGPDGAFHSGCTDGVVASYSPGKGCVAIAALHPSQIAGLAVQGDKVLTCAMDDNARLSPLPPYTATAGAAAPLGSCPSGLDACASGLAVAATEKGVVLLRGGQIVSTVETDYEATAAAITPDGSEVAVGGSDNHVHIFKVAGDSLEEEPSLEKHRSPVTALAYSPDGSFLASVRRDAFLG